MLTWQALHAELENMLRSFTRASSAPSTAGVRAANTLHVLYLCPHATICVSSRAHTAPGAATAAPTLETGWDGDAS
jgi:hypothetical protein